MIASFQQVLLDPYVLPVFPKEQSHMNPVEEVHVPSLIFRRKGPDMRLGCKEVRIEASTFQKVILWFV